MDGKERMDGMMASTQHPPHSRHPELVSGSYCCNVGEIKMLKQVQHDGDLA